MLFSKNLGRCHDTRLKAIVQGQQHCHQRHQSLTASHIALQQSVHLPATVHIGTHLFDDTLLRTSQLEGQMMIIESIERIANLHETESVPFGLSFPRIAKNRKLNIE